MTAHHPVIQAALWMAAALVSFILMAVAGRELAAGFSTFQILFFRSAIGVILLSLWLSISGFGQIKTQRLKAHAGRNIAHFVGQYGWFYGLGLIPLAEVIALEFTTPVWTAVLAAVFLREKLTAPRWLALVCGMVGLMLILRPGAGVIQPASLAVLAAAMAYACSYILTKSLTATDTPVGILFYMTLMQLVMGIIPAFSHWQTPEGGQWLWVAAVGVTALTAHYCMTRAFRLADAGVVVPLDFLRLPLIAVVGYLFYQEALDIWVLAGALIMFSGNLFNLRAELKRLRAD